MQFAPYSNKIFRDFIGSNSIHVNIGVSLLSLYELGFFPDFNKKARLFKSFDIIAWFISSKPLLLSFSKLDEDKFILLK